MLRSILLAGTIALSCAGMALPAEAQMRGSMGFNRGGFNGGWFGGGFERESPRFERFEERFESPAFERREPRFESREFERREEFLKTAGFSAATAFSSTSASVAILTTLTIPPTIIHPITPTIRIRTILRTPPIQLRPRIPAQLRLPIPAL